MMNTRGVAATALMLMSLIAVGCAGVERPTAQVVGAAVTERTIEGARIELAVRLDNPDDEVTLPIERVRYRVTVEGVGVFEATEVPAVALPPGEPQWVTLAAAFPDGRFAWADRRYRVRGTFRYRPPGQFRELLSQYRIPLPTIPFTMRGELSAPDEAEARSSRLGRR